MKTLAALVASASAANTVPVEGEFAWKNTTTAIVGDLSSNLRIGDCIRNGFIFCSTQPNLNQISYDSDNGGSLPTTSCVFDDTAANTWLGSNTGICSNEFTTRSYALAQLASQDIAACGADADRTITDPTTSVTRTLQKMNAGDVCTYVIKSTNCKAPVVSVSDDATTKGHVFKLEWNAATSSGMSYDSTVTSLPALSTNFSNGGNFGFQYQSRANYTNGTDGYIEGPSKAASIMTGYATQWDEVITYFTGYFGFGENPFYYIPESQYQDTWYGYDNK